MTGEVGCRGRLVDKKGGRWRSSRDEGPWLVVFRRKRGGIARKEGRTECVAYFSRILKEEVCCRKGSGC